MAKPDAIMDELIGYWHHALKTPFGLRLETPNPEDRQFLINQLYTARQVCLDEDLDALAIVKDATHHNTIWIVHKAHATDSPRTTGEDLD